MYINDTLVWISGTLKLDISAPQDNLMYCLTPEMHKVSEQQALDLNGGNHKGPQTQNCKSIGTWNYFGLAENAQYD